MIEEKDKEAGKGKSIIKPSGYNELPHQLHAESSSAAAKAQAKLVANDWNLVDESPSIELASATSKAWADTPYFVQELRDAGAWLDWRKDYKGGHNFIGRTGLRPLGAIRWAVDHHTVTNPTGNARKDVDTIAHIHLNVNKWGGIGYNYIITSEEVVHKGVRLAKVVYIGDISTIRAHTPNYKGAFGIPARQGNYYTLGIATIGAFHLDKRPSKAQYNSSHLLHEELITQDKKVFLKGLRHKKLDHLRQHKDFDNTACAGHFDSYSKFITKPPMERGDSPQQEEDVVKKLQDQLKRCNSEKKSLDNLLEDASERINTQSENIQDLKDEISVREEKIANQSGFIQDLKLKISEVIKERDFEARRRWSTLKRDQTLLQIWITAYEETVRRAKKFISKYIKRG